MRSRGYGCAKRTSFSIYRMRKSDVILLVLIAAAFIAVGVMVSALTENQLVAALGTMVIILVFVMISAFNSAIESYFLRTVLSWISVLDRFTLLCVGRFDISAIVYFISLCFSFLFVTVRIYEKRRWA